MTTNLIPADAPRLCERNTPHGPCTNNAEPGTRFCESHGGKLIAKKMRAAQYRLSDVQAQARIQDFANHTEIYSLREEIGMLRQFIENLTNNLNNDPSQQALSQAAISGYMATLVKMQAQSLKHEIECNKLYSEQQIVQLIQEMVRITATVLIEREVIDSEEAVDEITVRMANLLSPDKTE